LNSPGSSQARKSQGRLAELEKAGINALPYNPEELLRRTATLYAQNEFALAMQTLQAIPLEGQPETFIARVDLRAGLIRYRQRKYKEAEKHLTRATAATVPGVRSEARFWLAKCLERLEQHERALTLYQELAGEGKRQEFADDATMEAAGMRKSLGNYTEAARIYEQLPKLFPDSRFIARSAWELAWCRYLAGEYATAALSFKALLKDETVREKATYWLARTLESSGSSDAANWYRTLQDDYPSGFYATWHREQRGLKDQRESLGRRNALAELPQISGFEKSRLLASLGMLEESRNEITAARKKLGEKNAPFPGMARLYLENSDYGSAINLFLQNRPVKWDSVSLPLWTAGYPLVFNETVSRYSSSNQLSEAMVFALIRAESAFSPAVRSHAGAVGLMQLMPDTAKATAREKGIFNPLRLTIPEYNIKLGTKHLRELLKGYDGDAIYAIAAYNAGAAAVERWRKNMKGLKKDEFIENIPYQETRDYVKKVYASAAIYRQLYGLK
ncbi:MAG: transglycosylase SLT domain-containing protein, partial [Deltaproteobacteria bacterium]